MAISLKKLPPQPKPSTLECTDHFNDMKEKLAEWSEKKIVR